MDKSRFNFEETDAFLQELSQCPNLPESLTQNLEKELQQLLHDSSSVLFVATELSLTITAILVPPEIHTGENPRLIPTLDNNQILVAVSRDFVHAVAGICQDTPDQDRAQEMWNSLIDHIFEEALRLRENGEYEPLVVSDPSSFT
jgi:hypothetical protein